MPSLQSLTGRPSPIAWPEPAIAPSRTENSINAGKVCTSPTPQPYLVMHVVIDASRVAGSMDSSHLATRVAIDAPVPAQKAGAPLAHSHGHGGTISAARLAAGTVPLPDGLPPAAYVCGHAPITGGSMSGRAIASGALHTNSVMAAWAKRNGLDRFVTPR